MALSVHIVCQNHQQDRIIPRMARALRDRLGWTLSATYEPCDLLYLSGYFEAQTLKSWPDVPVAAYFTHKEEEPPHNAKARLFDEIARRVDLRIVTARMYGAMVESYGPTAQAHAPLERDRFVLAPRPAHKAPVIGVSGYTYANGRKGEGLVKKAVQSPIGKRCAWRASGRGWPVEDMRAYSWADMPGFYQSLDVLLCPSLVEGIPMPPLEALACGARVVIPRGVGLLDELPDVPGIYRYERGDVRTMLQALERAAFPDERIEPEQLRAVTEPYSVEAWCEDHARAFAAAFEPMDAGMTTEISAVEEPPIVIEEREPVEHNTGSKRGIYCVAFGGPAREVCERMMRSAKRHMPDIPICLCAASPIGVEDVFVQQPDSDIGGRRAKLRAYELAPAEWQAVLYLDADTEVVAPIYQYFEWVEDGWEFVICKDPHLLDTMHSFERRNNQAEMAYTEGQIVTLNTLQWNGGVWAFGRNERIAAFFRRWQMEWERYAQRDQGALVRAMYADPLKVWLLGNEWNTFEKYSQGVTTAGLMHYPGDARRWRGLIPGRIDSPEAWQAVKQFERRRR